MLATIANIVLPVFLIIGLGAVYGYKFKPNLAWPNRLNIDIFVPALIFSVLSGKDFQIQNYLGLISATVIIVLGSGLIVLPLLKFIGVSARTFLPPMMFNNTGNMGIPLLVLAFGETALPAAVAIFVTVNLLHFTLGLYFLDRNASILGVLKEPIVITVLAGLAFSHFQIQIPAMLAVPIEMLGQVSIPLMLVALGIRLADVNLKGLKVGVLGALLCPVSGMVLAYALAPWFELSVQEWGILLVFAAMPPAVLNFMLAEKYQQEPDKVASIVLIGNFASLIFIPLALWLALF